MDALNLSLVRKKTGGFDDLLLTFEVASGFEPE